MAVKHAVLSASSSERWLNCPPSARLCEAYEDKGSDYAAEGTDAHALCEFRLKQVLGIPTDNPIENLSWYNEEMKRNWQLCSMTAWKPKRMTSMWTRSCKSLPSPGWATYGRLAGTVWYAGTLQRQRHTVDFLTKKKKVNEGEIPQYYVEGNHEAIIQPEVFELVQQELKRRKQGRGPHSGVHLFSGKIRCGQCGEWYGSKVWHSNSKYRRVIWQCNHKYDGEEKCSTPHLTEDEIKAMFISAANKLIGKKTAIISPLRASLDIAFDTSALEAETEKLQEELMVASDLIQKCIYENAHVALDQREYQKRYDSLTARFDIAKARLEEIETAIADKKSRRAAIESFLGTLAQADLMGKFDPVLWCGLVDHVTVYSKDDVLFTFKNGQEIRA
jgi:hypothetical protein